MKTITIKITGSGRAKDIANRLRLVADDIEVGNHVNALEDKGECEWEDETLMTVITTNENKNKR